MPSESSSILSTQGTYYDYYGNPSTYRGTTYRHGKNFRYGFEGHYGYPDFKDRNVGGPMYLESFEDNMGLSSSLHIRGGSSAYRNHHYNGGFQIPTGSSSYPATISPDAWGADAFSKMKPTKPNFQALNAIYELREVPEQLRQRFLHRGLYAIPDYWLALQFGWKPLLNDIRNTVRTQMNAQKRLAQLLRDNGKPVRRRITLLDNTSTPVTTSGVNYGAIWPSFVTYFYRQVPSYNNISYTRDRVWASAQFRYWLPDGPRDINWRRRMIAAIFGLNPTPAVVWNALPWSWLVDWFTNAGTVISNLDAGVADRLAADYFYIMREQSSITQYYTTGYWYSYPDYAPVTSTAVGSSTVTVKTRAEGDPFGFATDQNTLSGMQLSILGALGLSRLR